MKALPQAMAGRNFPKRDHGREVERRDAGDHAERLAHRIDVDAGAGAVGEFALHHVRRADAYLDHFEAALNVALGVGDCLAMFAGKDLGEFVILAVHQFEELHQHAHAALRIGRRPGRLGRLGVFDGGAQSRQPTPAPRCRARVPSIGCRTSWVCPLVPATRLPPMKWPYSIMVFSLNVIVVAALSRFGRPLATRSGAQPLCKNWCSNMRVHQMLRCWRAQTAGKSGPIRR